MPDPAQSESSENGTQRIEAFSDGVFAIAITLMVLEIATPHLPRNEIGSHLVQALEQLWPSYFAYVFSFITVGIYWANHHYIFKLYKGTDHVFNLLNVLFLMCISFQPLPTAVLGEYMLNPVERRGAILYYIIGLTLPAAAWLFTWLYGSYKHRLIDKKLDGQFVHWMTKQYVISLAIYIVAIAIALWNPIAGFAIAVGHTFLYLLPPRDPVYVEEAN